VPFLGVSESLLSFCIISPWLPNGNILEYIRKHGGVNRLRLVSNHHNPCAQAVRDPFYDSLRKLPVVSNTYTHWVLYTAIFIR